MVSETRRERGPLLRTFEREAPREAADLRAEAHAHWPALELSVTSTSLCRTELVREYAEEIVTERSAPAAGPSITMGVSATADCVCLLMARSAFSNYPDTGVIDAAGRYVPSSRQVATGWAVSLAGGRLDISGDRADGAHAEM